MASGAAADDTFMTPPFRKSLSERVRRRYLSERSLLCWERAQNDLGADVISSQYVFSYFALE